MWLSRLITRIVSCFVRFFVFLLNAAWPPASIALLRPAASAVWFPKVVTFYPVFSGLLRSIWFSEVVTFYLVVGSCYVLFGFLELLCSIYVSEVVTF